MQISTPTEINTLNDYVFEYRNKRYGAYKIRKIYAKNLALALLIASVIFILFFLIFLINPNSEGENYKMVDYKTTNFSNTELLIPKVKSESQALALPEKVDNLELPPKPSEVIEEPKPTDKKLDENEPKKSDNSSTLAGIAAGKTIGNPLESVSQDTTGSQLYSKEIYMKVETNAQFSGGNIAFADFLRQNIVLPPYAKQNKLNGIIYVVMVVNTDGTIEDLKLYKGIEQSCNEEVLRVMKMSPNWIPARKDGVPVRQRLILPIKLTDNL